MAPEVSEELCSIWRMLYNSGSDVGDICKQYDFTYKTVHRHINGDCKVHIEDNITYDECKRITESAKELEKIPNELVEEFNVDKSTLSRHINSRCSHGTEKVTLSRNSQVDCDTVRRMAQCMQYTDISYKLGISYAVVRNHASGRCNCEATEQPVRKRARVTEDMCIYMRYQYYEEFKDIDEIIDDMADFFHLNYHEIPSEKSAKNHIRYECQHD